MLASSSLLSALESHPVPLDLHARRPTLAGVDLTAMDRAELPADVLIPLCCGKDLIAVLGLGPKRSGDVYTTTDMALVALVADMLASELRRFEQDARLQESQERQQLLRRYVPGSLADSLEDLGS